MANTVVGFFDSSEAAMEAVDQLVDFGIDRDNIDISSGRSGDVSTQATDYTSGDDRDEKKGNAISNFFKSLFGDDEDEVTRYTKAAQGASIIVTVHTGSEDEAEDAADILDEAGALDVDENGTFYSDNDNRINEITNEGQDEGIVDPLEEELEIGKKKVATGSVRVRSRIIERPVEEQLRLREEHVTVNRSPVDRDLSTDDYEAFEERDIEHREHSEVPVVNKEARDVEDTRSNEDATERDETVRDSVRNTEVNIDKIDSRNKPSDDTTGRKGFENNDRF